MPDEGFTELAAERVVLRRFQPADLDVFVTYRSLVEVARYQSWESPYPRAAGEDFIRQMLISHPDTAGEWFQFAVELKSTGALIGDCGAGPHGNDARQAEIGYTIAPEYQGHRFATEAGHALLQYLFRSRGKHRVVATCDPRNVASARVLQRLGMRQEAHLRESTWAKGEWTDDLLFAVLEREWAP
jgi:RimJ/RimL family protein N-acetyltransferase